MTAARSRLIFYILLIVAVVPLFVSKYTVTMDGPAHIHNVNLIVDLLSGNQHTATYLEFNPHFQPNYLTQMVLLPLQLILPDWLAEKILLLLLVVGIPMSMRWFIRGYSDIHSADLAGIMTIPLAWSFFTFMGFYNFIASIILMFIMMGLWFRWRDAMGIKRAIIFSLVGLATLIAHPVGLLIGIFLLAILEIAKYGFRRLKAIGTLLVACSPALLLTIFYAIRKSSGEVWSFYNLEHELNWIVKGWMGNSHPGHAEQEFIPGVAFMIFYLIQTVLFFIYGVSKTVRIWWTLAFLFVLGFFFMPFGLASGGFIPERSLFFFYVSIIVGTAIAMRTSKGYVVLTILAGLLVGIQVGFRSYLFTLSSQVAEDVAYVTSDIKDDSSILPVVCWNEPSYTHVSNVAGYDRSVVIFENYEAKVGHFPLVFKPETDPNGRIHRISNGRPQPLIEEYETATGETVDHILFLGQIDLTDCATCVHELDANTFSISKVSESGYVTLISRNN